MKIGVMQPYLFPYLGYYQLIEAVDLFIFYDNVNFIKQGWINRNRILINNEPSIFSIPVKKISSFTKINDVEISYNPDWSVKFLNKVKLAYSSAPYFKDVYDLLQDIILKKHSKIVDLSIESVIKTTEYIGLDKKFTRSSGISINQELDRTDKLIEMCNSTLATCYINMDGGRNLYSTNYFESKGIRLEFLVPDISPYQQFKNDFIPSLSIIDVLMFNSRAEVKSLIKKYKIEQ